MYHHTSNWNPHLESVTWHWAGSTASYLVRRRQQVRAGSALSMIHCGTGPCTNHFLQLVMNAAARLTFSSSRFDLISRLNWLKPSERIAYEAAVLGHKYQHGLAPMYLCDKLHRPADIEARQWLHSALSTSLDVRRIRLSTVADGVFPVAAAHLWNSLPSHVTAAPISPSSAVVLNHISSHFLIPLSDSSLIYTALVHWLSILDSNHYYI